MKKDRMVKKTFSFRGQSILEFTFATVVFVMLAYGMVATLRWGYQEMGHFRKAHDKCMDGFTGASDRCSGAETTIGRIFK